MDMSIQFAHIFGSRNFVAFSCFHEALEKFQEATGCKFIFKRTFLFPQDSPKRSTLVYKSIHYVCAESKPRIGTLCEASFNVGCRHGFLYVSKFNMLHNHECICKPPEIEPTPESYIVMTDYTPQFMEIFSSLKFSSYNELHSKMEEFQWKTGTMYAKRHTCPWPKDDLDKQNLVYKKYAYECYHYGYSKKPDLIRSGHRFSTIRTGCKSIVYVACRNAQLHIARFDLRHNHPVSGASGNIYRRNRRLNTDQQLAVKELLKEEPHEFALKEYVQNSFQLYLTTKDVRNLKRKLQPRKKSKELIGMTLKPLFDEGLVHAPVDEDGTHRIIAFTTPELMTCFYTYPEVIQIQYLRGHSSTGYSVYHISVIDRNLIAQSVFFAFIIDHHHRDTFLLMLQAFKSLMNRKIDEIETVFIDSNTATQCHAVRQELSWTRPLLYQCNVLQDVKDQLVNGYDHCRKNLFRLFYSALKAKNRDTYLSALEDILSTSHSFWEYINDVWMPYADQWAEHLRLSQVTFGFDTEHNWEELRHVYRHALDEEKSLDTCAKSLIEIALLRISGLTEETSNDTVSGAHLDLYTGQPEDIKTLVRLLSKPVAKRVLAHLAEPDNEKVLTMVSERKCFCPFNRQLRMLCRHLLEGARASYIPLPSLLKDSRWLLTTWQTVGCAELRQVAVKEEDQGGDMDEHDFLTPDSKFSRITPHLQTIQELAITSDVDKFKRRREELRELESRWLKEDISGTSAATDFM